MIEINSIQKVDLVNLKSDISKFIGEILVDHQEFNGTGLVPEGIEYDMAEAAIQPLKAVYRVSNYIEKQE